MIFGQRVGFKLSEILCACAYIYICVYIYIYICHNVIYNREHIFPTLEGKIFELYGGK